MKFAYRPQFSKAQTDVVRQLKRSINSHRLTAKEPVLVFRVVSVWLLCFPTRQATGLRRKKRKSRGSDRRARTAKIGFRNAVTPMKAILSALSTINGIKGLFFTSPALTGATRWLFQEKSFHGPQQ
jgi:hypothetical protein